MNFMNLMINCCSFKKSKNNSTCDIIFDKEISLLVPIKKINIFSRLT